MTENNQTNQDQDRLRQQQDQGRQAQPSDVSSSIGVQGEDPSFQSTSEGRTGAEGSMMDDEESQGTSATLSPTDGGTVGRGGGVDNADFAASGGTREQNLGRDDQAGTGAKPEGGIQQDRTQR